MVTDQDFFLSIDSIMSYIISRCLPLFGARSVSLDSSEVPCSLHFLLKIKNPASLERTNLLAHKGFSEWKHFSLGKRSDHTWYQVFQSKKSKEFPGEILIPDLK